jgi:hypothetical protein
VTFEEHFPSPQDAWDRKNLKQWHHELLEAIVTNPMRTWKEHAIDFEKSEVTISQVTRSDIFQAKLAEIQRRRDRLLEMKIAAKMDQAIDVGIDRVYEGLTDPDCDPVFALNAVNILDKRRRGEKNNGQAPSSAVVNLTVNASDLQSARAAIHSYAKSEAVIDNSSQELLPFLDS